MLHQKIRFHLIDQVRGLAVALMIIFHFFYDLRVFGYNQISFQHDPFWWTFPRVIVFLFLLSMGMALREAHLEKIRWRPFWRRFAKVAICAICISVVTYLVYPDRWIYFGTLHCIAVCSVLALPLVRYPKWALILGLALIIPSTFFGLNLPWFELPHKSMDYIPVFPWLGVVWLGLFLHEIGLHKWRLPRVFGLKILEFLGIHSLIIYLTHQLVLFGSVYLFWKLTNN